MLTDLDMFKAKQSFMSKTSLKILQSVSAGKINHFESGENDYKKFNEK